MKYADSGKLRSLINEMGDYAALLCEYGRYDSVSEIAARLGNDISNVISEIKSLEPDPELMAKEPDDYNEIKKLCIGGNKPKAVPDIRERMAGAVLGRFAGCTLGVPVEGYSIESMKKLAEHDGTGFPPRAYWKTADRSWVLHYETDKRISYTRDGINGVAVDDDITYTILGLLILEKYGFDFTTENVGELWKEILPYACTAEHITLNNLKKGVPAMKAGELDNPYCQWIGADIRADGFGYAAAGDPELAASLAYRDAYLSHRRNGIYGEMFFAAAIAAAFTVSDPIEAVRIGLREIPAECTLQKDIEWALDIGPSLNDFEKARAVIDERFAGMPGAHTNNNACLNVFGFMLGKGDFTETIAYTVAMGLDNDCTGATAGSIIGAIVGKKGIAPHWTERFNDKVKTYLTGYPEMSINDVIDRFVCLYEKSKN